MNLPTSIPQAKQILGTPRASGQLAIRSIALAYLAVILIIPLLVIVQDGFREGLGEFWKQITLPAAWDALKLTLWTSTVMMIVNTIMGTLTAFVLVRYQFPGKPSSTASLICPSPSLPSSPV